MLRQAALPDIPVRMVFLLDYLVITTAGGLVLLQRSEESLILLITIPHYVRINNARALYLMTKVRDNQRRIP